MKELQPCAACNEDCGIIEFEGNSFVYVECGNCGAHTAFFSYDSELEKDVAENKAIDLWNLGKIVSHNPGE